MFSPHVCNFVSYNFIILCSLKLHGTQCGIDRARGEKYQANEVGGTSMQVVSVLMHRVYTTKGMSLLAPFYFLLMSID